MVAAPRVVVFDVNGTFSDMGPMAARFAEVGAPEHLAESWFAAVLRDGFALAAAGSTVRFSDLAENVLRSVLSQERLSAGVDSAVGHIMSGFKALEVHPDVADGIDALQRQVCAWSR
jgi:2-haloacid dehalogenase